MPIHNKMKSDKTANRNLQANKGGKDILALQLLTFHNLALICLFYHISYNENN